MFTIYFKIIVVVNNNKAYCNITKFLKKEKGSFQQEKNNNEWKLFLILITPFF
jgi:hypothetical protein